MNQIKTGLYIAEKRKEKGYTQKQLASMLNVSDRAVSRWGNGLNMPDLSLMEPLCEILGITIADLFEAGDSEDKKPEETVREILKYSDTTISREKKKTRIVLIGAGIVLVFLVGIMIGDRLSYNKPLGEI